MFEIDINENELYKRHPRILEILLYDNTTKNYIIWATDSYKRRGYKFGDYITPQSISQKKLIVPRAKKAKMEQIKRSKDSAEVFTPSWMCNKQNNIIDEMWFGKKEVFNIELEKSWKTLNEKIEFPDGKTWIDYIQELRLEITCGEAPYLASRYDSVTGDYIDLKDRIGLLDRKFRILNENAKTDEEWIKFSIRALKSIYGYEWQGDNLLLARENIFFSYIDYYKSRFGEEPSEELMINIAIIISWNLWQMDGIKYVIPNSCMSKKTVIYNLFGEEIVEEIICSGCSQNNIRSHNGKYAKIMDWEKNKEKRFVDFIKGEMY